MLSLFAAVTCQSEDGCDPTSPLGWIVLGVGALAIAFLCWRIWKERFGTSWREILRSAWKQLTLRSLRGR